MKLGVKVKVGIQFLILNFAVSSKNLKFQLQLVAQSVKVGS